MFEFFRFWLLKALRVPPEPEPPFGDPASTRVFRASRKYYSLRLLGWGVGQLAALFGLLFGIWFMLAIDHKVTQLRVQKANELSPPPVQNENRVSVNPPKKHRAANGKEAFQEMIDAIAGFLVKIPAGVYLLILILKLLGIIFYGFQFFLTYTALRLDYEMRWYVVTDRSLRIRTGIWAVQELTMSFANLQQVMLSQGPVQRLLGIADVRVQSAGGGGTSEHSRHPQLQSLHTGFFHGVDNAPEVRDLILARLRHFQETGLGHPDEIRRPMPPPMTANANAMADLEAVSAARELLAETRQLRAALGGAPISS